MTCEPRAVGIVGTGSYVPPRILTNFDLEKMVDTSDDWIRTRTGIRERRIADPEVATSDLSEAAARAALDSAGVAPADIDLLIVATVTPDTAFPSTASILQQRLDIPRPTAFDLNVGCTGFVYGLAVAREMIATSAYQRALVIGSETLSRITDWSDRGTCVLFGDGAGAAVAAPVAEGGILAYSLGNDGTNADALKIRAGGSRIPTTPETVAEGLHYLTMNGPEVFKFAVRALTNSSEETVARAGLSMSDIDVVIPHQANMRIIEAAVKRLHIPFERFICNLDRYGNTSAASIPIALDEVVQEGRIKPGDHVLLTSFGAGLAWGTMVIQW